MGGRAGCLVGYIEVGDMGGVGVRHGDGIDWLLESGETERDMSWR